MTITSGQTDVLVVGAGLAGLSAAAKLNKLGVDVLVVDKGRGLGGRLAGRRIGGASFDHGAQFITTHDPRFLNQVRQWIDAGVAEEWFSSYPGLPNSLVHYRGVPTMNAVAKHLGLGLEIKRSTRVEEISADIDGWKANLDNGQSVRSRSLLITSPVPQTIELLAASNVKLTTENQARLARITYESCIAVLAIMNKPSAIKAPGAMAIDGGAVAWISDNQQKGVSATPAVTIHASAEFSAKHFDASRDKVARTLIEAATPYLGGDVIKYEVHGWRYSKPLTIDDSPCMIASDGGGLPPLVLAGDAFGGLGVEGAVLSGWAAAQGLADCLLPIN